MLIKNIYVLVTFLLAVDGRIGHSLKWPFRYQKTYEPSRAEAFLNKLHHATEHINHQSGQSSKAIINSNSNGYKQVSGPNQRYPDEKVEFEGSKTHMNPWKKLSDNRQLIGRNVFGWSLRRLIGPDVKFPSIAFSKIDLKDNIAKFPLFDDETMHSLNDKRNKRVRYEKQDSDYFKSSPVNNVQIVSKNSISDSYPVIYGNKYLASSIEKQKYPVTWYDSNKSRKSYSQVDQRTNVNYEILPSENKFFWINTSKSEIQIVNDSYKDLNTIENEMATKTNQDLINNLFDFFKVENIHPKYTEKYREGDEKISEFKNVSSSTKNVEWVFNGNLLKNNPYDSFSPSSGEDQPSDGKYIEEFNVSRITDIKSVGGDENFINHTGDNYFVEANPVGAFGESLILIHENSSTDMDDGINESLPHEASFVNSSVSKNNLSNEYIVLPNQVDDANYGSGLRETIQDDFDFVSSGFLQEGESFEPPDQPLKADVNFTDMEFRSFVFNPVARPTDRFQKCNTPIGELGSCRYVQHCLLPQIIGTLDLFLRYVCIIQERYIGVCCPDFPVHIVNVSWPKTDLSSLQENISAVPTQPKDGCGISSKTRIVGGDKADLKEWPWMAALSSAEGQFFCGGSLINSLYVLTAAHCTFNVPRNRVIVRLGEYDFNRMDDGPGEDYKVIEIRRHAQFNRKTLRNDIALLKLSRPARFGQFIGTLCLPEPGDGKRGETAALTGWGHIRGGGPPSDVLLEATFPVWSNAECAAVHGISISNVFICAGSRTKDKGACNGDSGGPLMVIDDTSKTWKGIGIVSWGRRRCDQRFPTVFTRVTHYLNWIKAHSS